ncbi:alpha/beta hydrolase [Shouchella lonarensis]|uniref:S-formylglutathione hydrolase FrmB n=1 Tax=Shouchella lonarensis TaxID=1464122 RepID=A0A1G6GXW2_9BACI|nr:alpha/beta hydrolase-fold protein [Shouchella lonarensis]SDB86781.1 S-formylglutathione hydrolase FrmB [Shouchella lonarensis]
MALATIQYKSTALGKQTRVHVILPEQATPPYRTLYLLHGWGDDDSSWSRQTSIERYANAYDLAVVMPSVDLSYYTDMDFGGSYFTFLSKELPERLTRYFPLSENREDQFVAGLSMGGFGAFKWALHHPERFAAAASFSGALDVNMIFDLFIGMGHIEFKPLAQAIFGMDLDIDGHGANLIALMKQHIEQQTNIPTLYQYCGTEDFVYPINVSFRDRVLQLAVPFNYDESTGGHTWDYWDSCIQNWLTTLKKEGYL